MSVRYWVGVIAGDHARHAEAEGICAFSRGARSSIQKLSAGDRFVFYSPRTGFMQGEPVQCFTALGTVIDPEPFEHDWAGHRIWAGRAAYAAVSPAPVRPLLERLKFVRNPARWGMAFRRGLFEITEPDFLLIEQALKSADN